jgi:replicative DNA helicase
MSDRLDFGERARPSSEREQERKARRKEMAGRGIPTGIDFLDDRLRSIHPTDLILVGAETGAGKTTLGTILARIAASSDRRATFFALEAYDNEIEDRLIFRELSQLAWTEKHPARFGLNFADWLDGKCDAITEAFYDRARTWFDAYAGNMRTFYRGDKFTADDIIRELLAEQERTDLFVFDHVHYVDHDDPSELRALKEITKALRFVSLSAETPVIAVAHLRKRQGNERKASPVPSKDDFHGSSDLTKIATRAILISPAREIDRGPDLAATYFRIAKDRLNGEDNLVAVLDFNRREIEYHGGYFLYRMVGSKLEPIEMVDKPWWAERARFESGVR